MKKTYKANNISCQSCANLIKNSLVDEFGIIEVNLDIEPKEVTLDIENEDIEKSFKEEMNALGFEIIGEKIEE